MADFKVTASQLNTQAESLQDLNGRFKSAIEQLVTSETSLKSMWGAKQTTLSMPLLQVIRPKWTSSTI